MSEELERLKRRLQRERAARHEAEALLERKSRDLFELNEQLERAVHEARRANEAKSRFLANMSHEIRTPMTAILGYADLLAADRLGPSERDRHLQVIRRNGNHLLALINDILDLSKIESNKMEVERIETSLWQIVNEVTALMRVRAAEKSLFFSLEFIFPVPESVRSDPVRVRQVLMNLVGNAVKFTESGGVRIVVRVDDSQEHPRVMLEVVDTGIGLTGAQVDHLFKPFSQADASVTRQFGGTGLGLTISKHLAQMLGGDITVRSTPGEGSSFIFAFDPGPLEGVRMIRNATECGLQKPEDDTSAPTPTGLRGRVLLAEDGPDNQRLISFILRKAGLDVTVAENGRIAVDTALEAQARGQAFDLVLMDMQMPEMDGYTATRNLRQAGLAVPIIALTANAMTGDRHKCIQAGCDDYASKPIDKHRLLELVAERLAPTPADHVA